MLRVLHALAADEALEELHRSIPGFCRSFAITWLRREKRREAALFPEFLVGGPNGIRTRVSALRGPCPRPLDDGAASVSWLGEEDSNPRYQGQNLASYP